MSAFLDVCRFKPTAGGTTDWTVSSVVTGYQTPASAGAINGTIYSYRAESGDLSQWEIGFGAYTAAGTVLSRTTVLQNSLGTTVKINFTTIPQVAIVALSNDLMSASDLAAAYVNVAGDTMTGTLNCVGINASSNIHVVGAVISAPTATTGTYYFGEGGTKYLTYDGTNFNFAGGDLYAPALVASSPFVFSGRSGTTGTYYFGSTGTKYLNYDGTNFNFAGGQINHDSAVVVAHSNNSGSGGIIGVAGVAINPAISSMFETSGAPSIVFNRFTSAGAVQNFNNSGTFSGSISVSGATTAFNTSSDERLKEDLKSFDAGNIIDKTNVYDFKWKDADERAFGVIAQQAKDIYPNAFMFEEEHDRWLVDYSKYVPVLLQELKALRIRVAELEIKVNQ